MPPSSEPVQERILDDVVTTLQGINGGATYWNTVIAAYVQRLNVAPPQAANTGTMQIFVGEASTEYDNERSKVVGTVAGEMRLQITVLFRTATDVQKTIRRAIMDVHTALYVDIQRSNLAYNTRLIRDEPFYPTEEVEPICGAEILVAVDYRAQRSDLSSVQT